MQQSLPFFLAVREGALSTSPVTPRALLHPHAPAGLSAQTLFGYRLPYLPDFLSDQAVVGATEAEKLAHALQRWAELVANLWKWHHCGFSLRFFARPDQGAVELALLVRAGSTPAAAQQVAPALAHDLMQLLYRLHIPSEPIATAADLNSWRAPFPQASVVELRQAEELAQLQLADAYVVYPYWAAAGDWLSLFETLVRQRAPVLLNLHLEPTYLTSDERATFARAASVADQLADFRYDGMYFKNAHLPDPHAAVIGRVYKALGQRLAEPFLLTVQVVSPDQVAVGAIAQATSSMIVSRAAQPASDTEREPPSQCQVVYPRSHEEYYAAFQTLTDLQLIDWGSTGAGAHQERLRYLADARGAAAAFRLPIALRGGVPGVTTRQVVPAYSLGARVKAAGPEEILLGTLDNGGAVAVHKDDLVRHGLIAGFTRSGKTNSCLNLLDQLWRAHNVPFLALEPVKTEYRGLLGQPGFEDLLVFTLGDESISPFRLNPFELLPGVRLEAHIGALRTCFDAALPQFGVLPMLIEEGIHEAYARLGWRLTDKGSATPDRSYPTLRDLHAVLNKAVELYTGEVKQNLQAALSKRIGSLLKGSKGRMFDTQRGIPIDLLMRRPAILEMDKLSEDEQPLAMMFMLMFVREYCKTRRGRGLQHVTLVEEAHLIMANAAPVSNPEIAANTQAEGSQAFERLLAEIGGLGEGVIIAEQSPSKLVMGAINNTSLKIAHQLVGPREVDTIGGAMIMEEPQKLQLQRLRVGHAAVFMSGYEKATFMVAPDYKRQRQFDDRLDDDEVVRYMQGFYAAHPDAVLPFQGCQFCQSRCRYRQAIEPVTRQRDLHRQFYESWQQLKDIQHQSGMLADTAWHSFAEITREAARRAGSTVPDAAWCYWVQQAGDAFVFQPMQRERFEVALQVREDPG